MYSKYQRKVGEREAAYRRIKEWYGGLRKRLAKPSLFIKVGEMKVGVGWWEGQTLGLHVKRSVFRS